MNREIENLINERQQLSNQLCSELINLDKGKTRLNLKKWKKK